MRLFWFIYSTLMCLPAILVAWIYYEIVVCGVYVFGEPVTVIRNAEAICAFAYALLAVAGWIIATMLLFKRR